ncbi:hypothetical protein [Streptomyces sp. NPDC052610]|uniref:hypothetical protein n=1 Tax=Streptomyces sp. NPDC052610 TaxID=3154952 RepID=UPI00342FD188
MALLTASVAAPQAAAADRTTAPTWYDATAETIATAGAPTQITNSRIRAIGWLATARATRSLPTSVELGPYQAAALAAAAHRARVTLAPSRAEQLDATYKETLDAIPDGPAEERGVAAGERQADLVLTAREGDGLDPTSVNAAYPVRPARTATHWRADSWTSRMRTSRHGSVEAVAGLGSTVRSGS